MKVEITTSEVVDITDYLDEEDVIKLCESYDVYLNDPALEVLKEAIANAGLDSYELKDLSLLDANKIEEFFEVFLKIPIDDLRDFLNRYK